MCVVILFLSSRRTDHISPEHQAELVGSISALYLTHLRLVVHYSIDLSSEDADFMPYAKDFVRDVVGIDHQRLATELMRAVPSLQHVFVSTGGEFEVLVVPPGEEVVYLFSHLYPEPRRRGRWFAHSAWRNSNGRGGSLSVVNPEKLDENVMERMLLDEDLTLSDIDNVSITLCLSGGAKTAEAFFVS